MKSLENKIEALMRGYYENYYRTQLGLKDWDKRIELRIKEEETYCKRFIEYIEKWLDYDFAFKKVLVVGCGTGGELVILHRKGADVFGIEPDDGAFHISLLKAKKQGIDINNIEKGICESLPFKDDQFDFVYCYTVLEHVSNVCKSVKEMVRVTKNYGTIFIETPDYRQFYEGHYKLPLPMFLPKQVNKLLLRILRRPTKLFNSLKFVNSRQLTNIFMELPVTAFHVIRPWGEKKIRRKDIFAKIRYFITKNYEIHSNQCWILRKENNPSKKYMQ